MLDWRIHYGDGTTFSSDDGTPFDAPCLDVQVVAYADPDVGRYLLHRQAHYWFDAGEWYAGDLFGLWDYLARPGAKTVKFGRTRPNQAYERILRAATFDPDLPPKSADR